MLCSWARHFTLTSLVPPISVQGTSKLLGKPDEIPGGKEPVIHWEFPSRGCSNTPSGFVPKKLQ